MDYKDFIEDCDNALIVDKFLNNVDVQECFDMMREHEEKDVYEHVREKYNLSDFEMGAFVILFRLSFSNLVTQMELAINLAEMTKTKEPPKDDINVR